MKKTLILLMLLTFTLTAWSQRGRGQRSAPTTEERIETAKKELALSDDQVADWKVIIDMYEDQIQEARQNRDREAGEALRTSMNEELMATLNEEQQEKFKEMQKNRPRRRQGRG